MEIPKPTGGTRPLGIAIVLDRLIQQSIAQKLAPIAEDPLLRTLTWGRPSARHDRKSLVGYISNLKPGVLS